MSSNRQGQPEHFRRDGDSGVVSLTVNGAECQLPRTGSLLQALRRTLGLTGAKYACGEGLCGACTVLVNGQAVHACMVPVHELAGRAVTTIEGLAPAGQLHPIQQAFIEVGAMQCGYCTPGMVLSTAALLASTPEPSDSQIIAALDGNLCRCCTYPRIMRAVKRAAFLLRATDSQEVDTLSTVHAAPDVSPRSKEPWDLLTPDKRNYFDVLGDGLLIVMPPGQELRAPGRRPGLWRANGGVWLHIGANGRITAFTGKVDVGQDNRTLLAQLVAEELRTPLTAVDVIMGDTDVSPFDMGTFGSRSTPDPGQEFRHAAATAREMLIDLAANTWEVDRSQVLAAAGAVRERGGARSLPYSRLVHGVRRLVTASFEAQVTPAEAWTTAGQATPRVTARQIVTGAARFTSDLTRPGLLHGKVLRPPAFGATLATVDASQARAMPGVTVVHEDGFVGVAAPDAFAAQRAIEAIKADWRLEPQPSEGNLEAYLRSHPISGEGWEQALHREAGNVDKACDTADVRLEATYTTAYIAHVPLETRVALAEWDQERLTVWTGTQVPFFTRRELAAAFGIPEARVRVVVPDSGGGFGGKAAGDATVDAARLARACGRPVRLAWTRAEEFTWGHFRPAAVIDVRSSAAADGRITSWQFKNFNSGSAAIACPYDIPNQVIDFQPAATPLRQGPYRALAATANTFARESHIDELAHELGVDPLDLRLRNLKDERLIAVLEAVANLAGWASRPLEPGHGYGIAGAVEKGGYVATCAEVRLADDGQLQVVRIITGFECGAIVNPDNLANQVEGATVMGLGGALFEAIHFDAGTILNPSLAQYRLPRMSDVPPIEVLLLNRPDLPSEGGGETPMIAVAPALANAMFAATGRRIRSMPLAPQRDRQ